MKFFSRGGQRTVKKHDFLRRVVRLCLIMMVLLTLTVIVMSAISRVPPDPASLGVCFGGWCGELLLTLLKRKFEKKDREAKPSEQEQNTEQEETS